MVVSRVMGNLYGISHRFCIVCVTISNYPSQYQFSMMANTMFLLHNWSFSTLSSYFVVSINIIKNRHHQYWLIQKWNSLIRFNSCIKQQQKESAFDLPFMLNAILAIIIAPVWDVQCNQDVAEAVSKFRSEKLQIRFFSEAKSSVDIFAI